MWIVDRSMNLTHSQEGQVSVRRWKLSGVERFEDRDLTDAEFRECDLTRTRPIGVVMQDAVIDGLVTNLVVNGVEVTSYVEAGWTGGIRCGC